MKKFRSDSTSQKRTRRSMQYYRLWIYSCNGVLGITSAIFAIFAAFVLADVRLSLLGGVELYHPTFLYAYTALFLQCGVVQTVGCLGAQRLSHKLLSVYWILLLLLTIGDVVVGIVWALKLDKVKLNLRPLLTQEFISKYSTDETFTRTWNRVQTEEHCCGVDGPLDYDKLSRTQSQHSTTNPNSSLVIDVESSLLSLPESCCIVTYDPAPVGSSSGSRHNLNKTYRSSNSPYAKKLPAPSNQSSSPSADFTDYDGRDGDYRANLSDPNEDFNWASGVDDDDPESLGSGNDPGIQSDDPGFLQEEDEQGNLQDEQTLLDYNYTKVDAKSSRPIKLRPTDPIYLSLISKNFLPVDILLNQSVTTSTNSTGGEFAISSEDLITPVPFLTSSLIKHKVRHGHGVSPRLNEGTQSPEDSIISSVENSASLFLFLNGTSVAKQSSIESTNHSQEGIPFIVGGSKSKAKSRKIFPSFSFSSNQRKPGKKKETNKKNDEPELLPSLPVPFTCQRHPTIKTHTHNTNKHNDNSSPRLVSSSPSSAKSETEVIHEGGERGLVKETTTPTATKSITSQVQISVTPRFDPVVQAPNDEIPLVGAGFRFNQEQQRTTSTSSKNNDPLSPMDKDEDDDKQNSFPNTLTSSSSSLRRRKRSKNGDEDSEDISTQSTISSDSPIIITNPFIFSFLSSSAFSEGGGGLEDAPELDSSDTTNGHAKRNGGSSANNFANDIQAAYYLSSENSSVERRFHVYRHGCGVKLIQWLDHVSGILFILGFCIIGFVKTCFLVILRTEIREMIEKIQMLELEDPASPTRVHNKDQRQSYVPHPLLAHPHRASTVSANAYNTGLPTIKSPEGLSPGPTRFSRSYQQRRHSNIIGDRSQSHSQETVNMTLLVSSNSNPNNPNSTRSPEKSQEKGRSNPNLSNACCLAGGQGYQNMMLSREDNLFDPSGFSISVPNTSKYLRRSSTCSSSAAHYSPYTYYDSSGEPRPGPSSRFYHHDPASSSGHPHIYQQHCHHYISRTRPHIRNISIGAVVHHSNSAGGNSGGSSIGAFKSLGGIGGSGGCSFSSKDENDILSASMENVEDPVAGISNNPQQSGDDKERREAEIRDWAAATACTDNSMGAGEPLKTILTSDTGGSSDSGTIGDGGVSDRAVVSMGDYSKAGFNISTDSAESCGGGVGGNIERQQRRRNGNNNVEAESIPLSYLGTAV